MVTAALLCLVSSWTATPRADVWVYPHSSNPGGEAYMRVWGNGDKAIDDVIPPSDAFSYGYLAFDISSLPKGAIKSASLTLWNVPNETLTAESIKANPLEVFGLKGDFVEESFTFDGAKCGPLDPTFGASTLEEKTEKGLRLRIDLKGKDDAFAKHLEAARATSTLYLAIGSKISPAESRNGIYKIATREAEAPQRPVLTIEVE